jgi:hypothetical protein
MPSQNYGRNVNYESRENKAMKKKSSGKLAKLREKQAA